MGDAGAALEPEAHGWFIDLFRALIHFGIPHSSEALYIDNFLAALAAVLLVCWRCRDGGLSGGWIANVVGAAAPIPVYVVMLMAPLDKDLRAVLAREHFLVALAGLIALVDAYKNVRKTVREARAKAASTDADDDD